MRLSIAAAKGTRFSFLVIPSASLSLPSFLLRSLNHTLRLLSLNNGEASSTAAAFFLFSLAAYPSVLGRGALSHVEVHSARSCNVVLARLVGKRRSRKLASPTRFSSTPDSNLFGIVRRRCRLDPAIPLKRARKNLTGGANTFIYAYCRRNLFTTLSVPLLSTIVKPF